MPEIAKELFPQTCAGERNSLYDVANDREQKNTDTAESVGNSGPDITDDSPEFARRRQHIACARRIHRTGYPDRDARASLALYMAWRSRRSSDACGLVGGTSAGREVRDADGTLHLQMGDRCAHRRRHRAGSAVELGDVGGG